MNLANAGFPVVILDQDEKILKEEWESLKKLSNDGRSRKNDSRSKEIVMGLITPTLSYEDLADVDIVVEAFMKILN